MEEIRKRNVRGMALFVAVLGCYGIGAPSAPAGLIEVGVDFFYNRSNYSNYSADSYTWTRRLGALVGYHFSEVSGIELSYENALQRTHIVNYQDTTFLDQVYSLSWIQQLLTADSPLQPFVKAGIGQLNRTASGRYSGGVTPPAVLDEVSGVLGAGLKFMLTSRVSIKGQFTSYLEGGRVRQWKDNIATSVGLSLYL